MDEDRRRPIDHQNPKQTPMPRGTPGANFGFGVLIVIAAALAVAAGSTASHGEAFLPLAGAWILGIPIGAIAAAVSRRRPGMAAGLLVSMGVILLIFASLCFYALAHI